MKKTISVNIKGINFQVEEHAYELLQQYLERLSTALGNQEGAKEILEDVELRIAELCSSKLNESKSVIEYDDIESILTNLGDPAEFVEAEDEEEQVKSEEQNNKSGERKLFRDLENSTIAGVCSGIANFFNIDVIIIRAIFIVMFFFAGFGVPLYIILWIVMPKAESTIDRLRMKGKPITVETLKEEVEMAADKIKKGSNRFANRVRSNQPDYERGVSRGVSIIATIIGMGMIAWGLFLLVMFLIFGIGGLEVFPVHSDTGFLSLSEIGGYALSEDSDIFWAWVGTLTVGFSIILFLILLGSMLVFKIKNKWSKRTLLGLFVTGFIGGVICGLLGLKTGLDMSIEGEIEREVGTTHTEELVVKADLPKIITSDNFEVKSNGRHGLISVDEKNITFHGVYFTYKRSQDSLFHIRQNLSAHSESHKTAVEKSKRIKHKVQLLGDTLMVDPSYSFPKSDKLRDQDVHMIIEIPVGAKVRFNNHLISLGSDEFDEKIVDENYQESGKLRSSGKYSHWD